jgi:hypothetical protein
MNRDGVKDLLDNEFKLGANASVAAGRWATGRSLHRRVAQRADHSRIRAPRASSPDSRSRVPSLRVDRNDQQVFYDTSVSTEDMVRGLTKTTPAGSQWTATLARRFPQLAPR